MILFMLRVDIDRAIIESVILIRPHKAAISDYYFQHGTWPKNNAALNLLPPEKINGDHVKSIGIADQGKIIISYNDNRIPPYILIPVVFPHTLKWQYEPASFQALANHPRFTDDCGTSYSYAIRRNVERYYMTNNAWPIDYQQTQSNPPDNLSDIHVVSVIDGIITLQFSHDLADEKISGQLLFTPSVSDPPAIRWKFESANHTESEKNVQWGWVLEEQKEEPCFYKTGSQSKK